jgi:hypothetical protein
MLARSGWSSCLFVSTFLVLSAASAAGQDPAGRPPRCEADAKLVRVPQLPEGSGIAASQQSPGRFWTHNDSGAPVLFALDAKGAVVGQIRVAGAKVGDWEAVAVGPCPSGSCIYVGDIGDNDADRREVLIHRFPEPADSSATATGAELFRVRYPDGAHNAETLLVTPKADVLIVTKGDTGTVRLYRLPADAKPGTTVTLQAIGKPRPGGRRSDDDRITDGAVSPGGMWVALRTKTTVFLYRTDHLLSGDWREAGQVSLNALGEPQGEGIAFGDEKTVYLVGEGGKKSQPGTFGRLTCAF